ncbi:bifunctional diaminohydroxyphosphoribosylaminopyrimidine deaminase/5-amino-6-(5-phosphoribosylamino)uracil reductase RibD [Amycolatopsis sp. NPDC058986]|uniref:bifunctional diaminohydroxyphosphoribosylaminopyrimidine deaminase/5-amino-6-(5-phosphoribosylamino)uracil reductase RibD n=1 Tax=unclassified Amycolatopsis TaxID=2618356 RepID=UPI00366F48C9
MSASDLELGAMRRAIALSALGLSSSSPNPPVGCVVLDADGRPVGEGYHQRKGEPHAEVRALAAAEGQTVGGTALVTLEPCNHHGRTPPCHQALLDAGIGRVLIAIIDPTSRGVGGAARLRDAGVDVEIGILADEARVVLGPWLATLDSGRPKVTWAFDATGSSPSMTPEELLTQAGLCYQFDAVVHPDGHVDEGLAGAHGPTAFELPPKVPVDDPVLALSLLQQGGARTVLLNGGRGLVSMFVERHLVDEMAMFLTTQTTSLALLATEHFATSWTGCTIRSVRRLHSGVLVTATRDLVAGTR